MKKEITFDVEKLNSVRQLANKYASKFEFVASTKDGETYEVDFTNSIYYQNFFQEYQKLV